MDSVEIVRALQRIVAVRGKGARLSEVDREDMTQHVLEQYLRAWTDAKEPENVAAWIETATRNAHLNSTRDDKKKPALVSGRARRIRLRSWWGLSREWCLRSCRYGEH
jgi:DNA-directed RNA polymerase specialized sigma24 family protein